MRRFRFNNAVTPMVGTIFVIAIVVIAIATVMLWSGPFIEQSKIDAQISNVHKQFDVVEDTHVNLIDKGAGSTEENEIAFESGTLLISETNDKENVYYSYD